MASPADISISFPNPNNASNLGDIDNKINQNFRFYTFLTYITLLVAPVGFIITLSVASPDSFGMVLLVTFELLLVAGSVLAILAKRKSKAKAQDFAIQLWCFTVLITFIFILYVLMVLGDLKVSYTWKIKNYPVTATVYTGKSLKIVTLAYFLPLNFLLVGYLVMKSFAMKKLLHQKTEATYAQLRAHSNTTMTLPNQQLDISTMANNNSAR